MSFFAQLLAGAATGIGKGMVDKADYNDKLAAQQELLKEKHANALQLQSQRADDRLFQAQTLAALKGSGSGGSGGGDPIMGMLRAAKTPEEQQQAIGYIRAMGGDDAAASIEQNVFGRVQTRERKYDTVDALGDGTAGQTSVTERVEYDKMKGQQALNRVYALIANKGDTKGNAQGEDQYMSNDLRAAGLGQALKGGKPLDEASAYASKVSDPATYDKNKTNADRVSVTDKNADARVAAAEAKRLADVAKAEAKTGAELDQAILSYEKLKKDARPKDRDVYDAVILDLKTRRAELTPKVTTPASTSSSWPPSGSTTPDVQNSLARFSALRKGQPAR